MAEESARLIDMVNSLLDLSRIEAGKMIYHFTQADLVPMINKVAREIEPLAETKNVKIEQNIIKKIPVVKVDLERILQVLRNLIGNAVKFTPAGGYVRVSAELVERGIRVSVKDTGAGISKENLTLIFDKFHQAFLTSSSKIKGSGLGLSYVKHIIKAHGGEVWAESKLGQGSTFTFTLPV
jgi:two-component system sensor histidine kinase GlrK